MDHHSSQGAERSAGGRITPLGKGSLFRDQDINLFKEGSHFRVLACHAFHRASDRLHVKVVRVRIPL
jgi:hypothetical protein